MIEIARLAGVFILGIIFGFLYFYTLWRSVRAMATGPAPWKPALTGAGVRLALLLSCLAGFVIFGATVFDILAGLVGLLTARVGMLSRIRPAGPHARAGKGV